MPFDRPDLRTLINRTTADINSRFAGSYNALRRRVAAVFARVLAGLAHGLYGFIEWAVRQIFTDTQDEAYLLRDGTLLGVIRKQGDFAAGNITAVGNNGATIAAGTLWQRGDGVEFVTVSDAVIVAGSASVSIQATEIGSAANTDPAAAVDLVQAVDGINGSAVVAAGGITGGLDEEPLDAYRQRVIERKATYFTGANKAIYKKWALEVPGITRAWVYEQTPAPGSLTILCVSDDQPGGIVPDAAKIAEVADYLEEHTDPITGQTVGRAVNASLVVAAPATQAINFTIAPVPNTAVVRAAIQAELTDLLRREAVPGGTILLSHIREAISLAAGETDYVLTAPAADVTAAAGAIAIMGVITWL